MLTSSKLSAVALIVTALVACKHSTQTGGGGGSAGSRQLKYDGSFRIPDSTFYSPALTATGGDRSRVAVVYAAWRPGPTDSGSVRSLAVDLGSWQGFPATTPSIVILGPGQGSTPYASPVADGFAFVSSVGGQTAFTDVAWPSATTNAVTIDPNATAVFLAGDGDYAVGYFTHPGSPGSLAKMAHVAGQPLQVANTWTLGCDATLGAAKVGTDWLVALGSDSELGATMCPQMGGAPTTVRVGIAHADGSISKAATWQAPNQIGAVQVVPRTDGAWIVVASNAADAGQAARVDAKGAIAVAQVAIPYAPAVGALGDDLALAWASADAKPTLHVELYDGAIKQVATAAAPAGGGVYTPTAILGSPAGDVVLVASMTDAGVQVDRFVYR